ncbi:ComF family protein [Aureispira anguillae]|uniref:ComF family protein n=1 Tax=Aureispira anguillae TaxID=2864201 RepID=A0A916DWZ4_9BACT|nr:ComF family protein [Aureispira anguillae]BDS14531.1 ComF family protein [Aureispira anguillae]
MNTLQKISTLLQNFSDLIYPRLCLACGKKIISKQTCICIHCTYHISPTNYHTLTPNPVLDRFWGRIDLEHASTSFAFNKGGLLQHLIHQLKYENKPQIGIELGKQYGTMLKETAPYNTINCIIPVPLHPKKEHQRGYNQAAAFAEGLAIGMQKRWSSDYLYRVNYTETQTKKSRLDRFSNVQNAFSLKQVEDLKGKHLLIVDDVITTGATLEACAQKLLEIGGVKVSIVAIALAN